MTLDSPFALVWIVPLLFFPALWCAITWLLSRVSGWQRLAEAFPARTEPSGRRIIASGTVGWVGYRGCLYVHVAPEGIFLSVMWLFSLGHRPLFIPWKAIHNRQTRRFLWKETVKFDVGMPCIATMQLPKKVFENEYAPPAW
jgi:hypothetical protein